MLIYLYVKTHNKTGLKYLGKTTKLDPHKYSGSGKRWLRHLKKHGFDYTTEILLVTATKNRRWMS
jgi:transposase